MIASCPTDDASRVEIDDGFGEIDPTFPGSNISNVSRPRLIRTLNIEAALETIRLRETQSDRGRCIPPATTNLPR